MANRLFQQFRFSLEKAVVDLYIKVTIGASGAATVSRGKGVTSVSKTATGVYEVVLMDKYVALLSADLAWIKATTVPGAPLWNIDNETVATDGKLKINFWDADTPAATEPASGDIFLLHLALSNSTAL